MERSLAVGVHVFKDLVVKGGEVVDGVDHPRGRPRRVRELRVLLTEPRRQRARVAATNYLDKQGGTCVRVCVCGGGGGGALKMDLTSHLGPVPTNPCFRAVMNAAMSSITVSTVSVSNVVRSDSGAGNESPSTGSKQEGSAEASFKLIHTKRSTFF